MTRNRSLAIAIVLAALIVPLGAASASLAQATIPQNVKTSAQPETIRPAVQAFISAQVENLKSDDAAARSSAREALISESEASTGTTGSISANSATSSYIDVYAQELNDQLTKLLEGGSLESRLNAGIIAARVARGDRSARLEGVARAAMQDEQAPVVLWGLKSAAQLLPAALTLRTQNNPLLAAASAAAQQRAGSPLVIDAYDALTLTSYSTPGNQLPSFIPDRTWQQLAPVITPEALKLWDTRLKRYAANQEVEPAAAESIPVRFFASLRTWPNLSPQQQVEAMQLLSDQLALALARASESSGLEREQFINLYKTTAQGLQVIGGSVERNQGLADAAKAAAAISTSAQPDAIAATQRAVFSAIKAIPKYKDLKQPPKLEAESAASSAATKPS